MGKINVDYDVLNQKGSPAWYSDLFANIPTPGYAGRMFISTDTFAFYRDNGVGWDLTGGPGTGTITGSGVSGQVTFFNGTATIGGSTNLIWDNTNNRLGIGVASPTVTLEISGSVKATALVKSGGTSAQILLADGTTTPTSTFQAAITLTTTGTTGASTLVGATLNVPTYTFVSSVSALTLGTSGTDLTSSVANSTTTPVITLNVPTASATNRGALSSADWTTFNNKQATITLTTTGTSGAATLVGATLNVPNYTNVGTVTSVAALTLGTSGTDLSSTVANSTSTPVITLNVPTASATNRGALSTTDWTTFNNKQATISVTSPVVLTGATISMPAATTSVNGYLTSTDWNTFNNKSNTNGTVTSVVALTIGTSGIDITSTAVTTTTTPVITLNIPTASASNRGALSSTDWTTFNNKQATLSLTTTGTSGVATLVANTLNVPNYGSALSGYLPLTGGTLTGALGGTSASFSSSVTSVGLLLNTGGYLGSRSIRAASDLLIFYGGTSGFNFTDYTNSTVLASINNSGAGVFSSSVTVQSVGVLVTIDDAGKSGYTITNSAAATTYKMIAGIDGTSNTGFSIRNVTAARNELLFNSSGAATFSSSITATNLILNGSTTTAIDLTSGTFGYALDISNNDFIRQKNVAGTLGLILGMSTDDNLYVRGFSGINLQVNNGTTALTLAVTTGAATFSNSVTLSRPSSGATILSLEGSSAYGDTSTINFCDSRSYIKSTILVTANGNTDLSFATYNGSSVAQRFYIADTGAATFSSSVTANSNLFVTNGSLNFGGTATFASTDPAIYRVAGNDLAIAIGSTERLRFTSVGILNSTTRANFLGATDNALFSLNSGGTLYTVGFSPTATASSTNTLTLTTGTTTWIYTGTGTATWTLPNPSGNNQIYWIKNAGTGIITLNAFSGTNIINNAAASVGSITIAVGGTAVIAQDGNVKSYQLQ